MASPLLSRFLALLSPLPREAAARRYLIAVAAAVLAIVLRWVLDPLLGHVAFYVTVYIAVAFCAVVCGFAPAVLSGALGFFGIFYWFVDPRHSLGGVRLPEVHAIVGFILLCAVLTALGDAARKKQLLLNDTIVALTTEARERSHAENELRKAHDELEQRVDDRTRELSQTLVRLESEIKVREQSEAQQRQLSLHLMTLQDEERRRIARDLHDTAGQTLAAMKMSTALIRHIATGRAEILRLLDDLDALADDALQEVRTTSYLLHPPLLDEAGFASAARWFADGFSRRSGIHVECDIPEQMERPPRDCELVLFRVLQESLTNVHRHSGASAASIRLSRDSDQLKLEVGDNGKGISEERLQRFNSSVSSAGVGITGMRERVRELGGRLEIQSIQTGTIVRVALPALRRPNSADAGRPKTSSDRNPALP
ncbi:MAG TPA: sensor histidine kinase [Candidatus Sulfotelmatobacter sp.]|jgi:signal transduction histidine kinase